MGPPGPGCRFGQAMLAGLQSRVWRLFGQGWTCSSFPGMNLLVFWKMFLQDVCLLSDCQLHIFLFMKYGYNCTQVYIFLLWSKCDGGVNPTSPLHQDGQYSAVQLVILPIILQYCCGCSTHFPYYLPKDLQYVPRTTPNLLPSFNLSITLPNVVFQRTSWELRYQAA